MSTVPRNKGSYNMRANGHYQVKYPTGFHEATGRYEAYREEVPTEAEAISLIKSINDFVYHGGAAADIPAFRHRAVVENEADTVTFAAFARDFIEDRRKQRNVSERTIADDEGHVRRIDPYLGDCPVSELTAKDIDELYSGLFDDERAKQRRQACGRHLPRPHPCDALDDPRQGRGLWVPGAKPLRARDQAQARHQGEGRPLR